MADTAIAVLNMVLILRILSFRMDPSLYVLCADVVLHRAGPYQAIMLGL